MKYGNLNFLEHSGPLQACNGTDLPLPHHINYNTVFRKQGTVERKVIVHKSENRADLFQAVTFLTCIRVLPGSNPGLDTLYNN